MNNHPSPNYILASLCPTKDKENQSYSLVLELITLALQTQNDKHFQL